MNSASCLAPSATISHVPPSGARIFKPALLTFAIVAVISGGAVAQSFAATRDVVPDSKTAIAAGGAFLLAYFGGKYRPDSPGYDAVLKGDVWTVGNGYRAHQTAWAADQHWKLSKREGRVLRIYLTQ